MSALSRFAIAANCVCAVLFSVAAYLALAEPPDTLFTKPAQWDSMTLNFPAPPRRYPPGDDVTITVSRIAFLSTQKDYWWSYRSRSFGYKKMTVRYGEKSYDLDLSKHDQQLQNGSLYFSLTCIQWPTDREKFNHLVVIVPWRSFNQWKLARFIGDYGEFKFYDYKGTDEELTRCWDR